MKLSVFFCAILTIMSFHLKAQGTMVDPGGLHSYLPPAEKEGGWRKNTDPAFIRSLGIDPQKLEDFGRWNVENNWDGKSLRDKSVIVIKDGWIVGEWYGDPEGNPIPVDRGKTEKARLASNGKSVAITLFGNVPGTWTSGQTDQVGSRGYFPEYPADMFRLSGSGLNKAYIIPSMDLVVVRTSQIYPSEVWNEQEDVFLRKLFAAVGPSSVMKANDENETPGGPVSGQIMQDPFHPDKLVYNRDDNHDGKADPFFLCGPGDPEGFLYRGKRNADGTRKGDQMQLIEKLNRYGGNSVYFIAVRTNGGDAWKSARDEPATYPDALQNPWVDQDPAKGLNLKMTAQWEKWFDEMDRDNIVIYFFIYDDAIDIAKEFGWALDESGNLDPREKAFITDLVNQFKHHKNLIWCTMEEGQELGDNWKQHISKIAEAIHDADEHHHIIASHQLPGNIFFHKGDRYITQFAVQTEKNLTATTDSLHQWLLTIAQDSRDSYCFVMSEDYTQGNVSCPNGDRDEIRQRNWASAMSGAYVMVLGMDIEHSPETWLHDCRILQNFFEETTFNGMYADDGLAYGQTSYVLADPGYDYILYSANSKHTLGIKNLTAGTYSLTWIDCISGEKKSSLQQKTKAGNRSWNKPAGFSNEVALYLHREDKQPDENREITRRNEQWSRPKDNIKPAAQSRAVELKKDSTVYIQMGYTDGDGGPGPYTIMIETGPSHGTLSGVGNDRYYKPEKGFTGEDRIVWRVNDGKDSSEPATIIISVK